MTDPAPPATGDPAGDCPAVVHLDGTVTPGPVPVPLAAPPRVPEQTHPLHPDPEDHLRDRLDDLTRPALGKPW
jgi:hypothetical protein